MHQLVYEAKGGHNPADNSADRREKGNVSLPMPLDDLDVKGRDFVKEKDTGKACCFVFHCLVLFRFVLQYRQHKLGLVCVCVCV
jgi:hypothetical protein